MTESGKRNRRRTEDVEGQIGEMEVKKDDEDAKTRTSLGMRGTNCRKGNKGGER